MSAMMIMSEKVMGMPAAVTMKVTANMCIMVVPFMLMVMPVGRTKLVTSFEQPSSSIAVLVLSGSVAAEELTEKPKTPTLSIFRRKVIGFSPVMRKTPAG